MTDNEMNLVTIRYNGKIVASSGYMTNKAIVQLCWLLIFREVHATMHGVKGEIMSVRTQPTNSPQTFGRNGSIDGWRGRPEHGRSCG